LYDKTFIDHNRNGEYEAKELYENYLKTLPEAALQLEKEPESKYYDMDFGGYCKARVKVTGDNVEVQMAMNGYGEPMDVGEITFEPITK
jgi:hypothetical protein